MPKQKLIAAPSKRLARSNGQNVVVSREAPQERAVEKFKEFNTPAINEEQFKVLYGKTPDHAIRTREGRGGRTFRYIQHGHTTDRLNKAFGFSWSFRLLPISAGEIFILQIYNEETKRGEKQVRDVAVYGELTVNFFDEEMTLIATCVKGGPGSQRWEMGTEFGDALKGATSDAKKFCAKELGIGLDLYYDDDAALEQYEMRLQQQEELRAEQEAFNATPPAWVSEAKAMRGEGKSSKVIADKLGVTIAEVNKWVANNGR